MNPYFFFFPRKNPPIPKPIAKTNPPAIAPIKAPVGMPVFFSITTGSGGITGPTGSTSFPCLTASIAALILFKRVSDPRF